MVMGKKYVLLSYFIYIMVFRRKFLTCLMQGSQMRVKLRCPRTEIVNIAGRS